MIVTNISVAGLQIKLNRQRLIRNAERLVVSFHLDDEQRTEVRELVVIKNAFGFYAGAAFNARPENEAYYKYIDTQA